ncbi:MAG: VWA domain-containing protein [Proteobacteria bacterium]|nr:VWA domain-containing protein [Pseudomonadota bacterium]
MQFINPSALLGLGLIPILIVIHSLKPKPKRVEVTTLFLWREALKEKRGGLRIQRIMKNLPLLLQILAVTLATLALAKPVWVYTSQIRGNVILVLDASASMKTRAPTGMRFDEARKKAVKLIDDLPKESKMLIIEAGSKPVLKSAFSNDKRELKRTVENMQASDEPGRIEKALYLALSFMKPERDDWTFLITDGAGSDFEHLSRIHQRVRPILVPGGKKNIGITKFEFRPELGLNNRYEIMVEVRNFNPNPVVCPIHLTLNENTIVKKTIGLRALEKKLFIFPYSSLVAGIAEVTLGLNDDFPIDNKAYAVLNTSKDIWVLLVTKGNYCLERLLEAYPNFMVNSVKEIIPSSWEDQTTRHDIVILDRISPPSTEKGNFLLIESFSPSIPLSKIGQIDHPQVLDWERRNPLMANLDLSGLIVESATQVKVDRTVQPIIESHHTGLMYSYHKSGIRAVFLGFDLTRSDLPLRVAFPVMMSNIFQWLGPTKLGFSSSQIKAGNPFTIYLEPQTKDFSIRTPSGRWNEHRLKSNPFDYANTREVGIYTVIEGEKWKHFAVNLVDEWESDIRVPTFESSPRRTARHSGSEPITGELPLWIVFLLSVSATVIIEWHFWLKGR